MKINSGPVLYSSESIHNGFKIIGVISEGRTFRVFKAQAGTKFVILKAPLLADTMSVEILRREYELSSELSHPCIVNTIGFEEETPVGPAIIMEFIDGLTLDEFVAGRPSVSRCKSVLKDILDGVDYLHHKGILHNDLKPDNIIINSGGAAHIIDFGLSISDDSVYRGCIGGSDGYTAPEILDGRGPAGAASDIYSLGLLIKLLFGGKKYESLAAKCSRAIPAERYQSVPELRRAVSRRNSLPWYAAASFFALSLAALSLMPGAQKKMADSRILGLEEEYEAELAPRFDEAVRRMQEQECQNDALVLEQEYFNYYLRLLDSLQRLYPASDTGESSPETIAFCTVGRKQQDFADSVIRSLPFKKEGN